MNSNGRLICLSSIMVSKVVQCLKNRNIFIKRHYLELRALVSFPIGHYH